jgi:uncharacterized circularly permuted ATP-grasp superfamily protein
MYTYVPAMIDYYLGETPVLENVATYRLDDPDQQAHALDRLGELVLKPVDASGGYGILVGPSATDEQLAQARAAVRSDPRGWVAQEVVALSTSPTQVHDGLRARLTRVALPEGSLVVNSSQGGGSKDTWVLAGPVDSSRGLAIEVHDRRPSDQWEGPPPGLVLDPGPSSAHQQQQQQQQQQQRQAEPAAC